MGCIRSRSPGSYQLLYYYQGKQKSKTVKASKRDAEKLLREIERSIDLGTYDDGSKKAPTVEAVSTEWLAKGSRRWAPSTYQRYHLIARDRILPRFGKMAIEKLGPGDVQKACDDWEAEGLRGATVSLYKAALSSLLNFAFKQEIVHRNAATRVTVSLREGKPHDILDDEQIGMLLSGCCGKKYGPHAALAVLTGLRVGELCGLRWGDVDLEKGEFLVCRSVSRVAGKQVAGKLKTKASIRLVSLGEKEVGVLKGLPRLGEYVFGGDEPLNPDAVSSGVKRLCRELGFSVSIHDLRHSHASMLTRGGVHPRVVQERLGHSSFLMTMVTYTHVLPSQQSPAVAMNNDIPMT